MAEFMMHLADNTELVWASISNYEWGLRAWMQLQHQTDVVRRAVAFFSLARLGLPAPCRPDHDGGRVRRRLRLGCICAAALDLNPRIVPY